MGKKKHKWTGEAPELVEWDRWLAACGRSPKTRRLWVGTVRRASEAGALHDIDTLTVWLGNPTWAASTRRAYTRGVASYLTWARDRGWRLPNPQRLQPCRPPPRLPRALSAE